MAKRPTRCGIRGTVIAATLLLVEQCPCQPNPTLPNLKLEWPQVQGCPTGDEVRRAVAQHLGESSGHTNEVDATAVIEYRVGYHLVLSMRGSSGQDTRELNGETCRSVVDAAVVILAVTLGAEAGELARNDGVTSTVVAQSSWSVPPPTAVLPTVLRVSGNMKLTRRRFELSPTEMPNSSSRGIGLGVYVPFHIARSAYRRKRLRAAQNQELASNDAVSTETPVATVERVEATRILMTLLDGLDEHCRTVFVLVELEELSMTEAAEAIGSPVSTAYKRLANARRQFERAVTRKQAHEGWRFGWNR